MPQHANIFFPSGIIVGAGVVDAVGSIAVPTEPQTVGSISHGEFAVASTTGLLGAGYTYDSGSDTYSHTTHGALTPSGSVFSSANGQTFENLDIDGIVSIQHDNVTLRNCRIYYDGLQYAINLRDGSPSGCLVEHCTIYGPPTPAGENGAFGILIGGSNNTVQFNDISRQLTLIYVNPTATGITVDSNYCHEPYATGADHGAGISVNTFAGGVTDITVARNWIESCTSSAFSAYDQNPINGMIFEDNYLRQHLEGTVYLAYFGATHSGGTANSNLHILGNVFERSPEFPNGGSGGPWAAWNGSAPGAKWCNNSWSDNGDPVGTDVNC